MTHRFPDAAGRAALAEWLSARLPGHGELVLTPLDQSSGNSHQILLARRNDRRWVVRVAPADEASRRDGAFDLEHEWSMLRALSGSDVPHAAGVLLGDESTPVDNPVLVVEYVDGTTLHGPLPSGWATREGASAITDAVVDALARIGRVDWEDAGVRTSADETGYLPRQCAKGRRMIESARSRDTAEVDRLLDVLEREAPARSELALIHGDFSTMNVMLRSTSTPPTAPLGGNAAVTVVDWETATVGDALIDIGYLTARWVRPEEDPILAAFTLGGTSPAEHDLLPGRDEVAHRYAEVSGRPLDLLPYYQAFAMARLCAALEPRVARARSRGDADTAGMFSSMVDSCARLGLRHAGVS